ncbi:ceramide transfer protein-like [Oppia nitens]|uniref:ceramide transfer protein-like n=1 Tax=Oppia nitens TaxID=1686743 RepID=UPI0023DC55D2|nr:ceramide transfer protein-like [Oppia nitens]
MSQQMSLSDDEDIGADVKDTNSTDLLPPFEGVLQKWTNYIHGWQQRFIALKDGTLTYYKSADETAFGCRGAVTIIKAQIKLHEFDDCRFDVGVSDCVWYLRAQSIEERNRWVDAIEGHRQHHNDSAYSSDNSLRRHGSAVSLGSVTSVKSNRGLKEKLNEIETFRDILCQQVESLQKYYNMCAQTVGINHKLNVDDEYENNMDYDYDDSGAEHVKEVATELGPISLDLKRDAITFKATTAGIIATLSHCIELMHQREDNWKRRLDKEIEKRKKLEEILKQNQNESTQQNVIVIGGPDYEEGPHSMIKEDEFFDAVDAALDRNDIEEQERRQMKLATNSLSEPSPTLPSVCDHPLWSEIERVTTDQLYYSRLEIGEGGAKGWELFAEDGEMRLYKRELEIDGLVCDPLKAVHVVNGISGHEMCYHFFSPDVRFDWENTLESMKVVEEINTNTLIFHQIHKRVWPAAQRDTTFWSHIRRTEQNDDNKNSVNPYNIWIVCNNSTDRPNIPLGRCLRMTMTVSLVCETYINPIPEKGKPITRDNLKCKIIYCSTINPGGWAPASVLRALYKREYPKFLKRFTQYVKDVTENKEIML